MKPFRSQKDALALRDKLDCHPRAWLQHFEGEGWYVVGERVKTIDGRVFIYVYGAGGERERQEIFGGRTEIGRVYS